MTSHDIGTLSDPARRQLSVVVPAFNEEEGIAANLLRLYEHISGTLPDVGWELIAVDDGSRDRTADVLENFAERHAHVRVLRHERNRGLGAALETGISAAMGACVITLDSDLSYAPPIVNRLYEEWKRSAATLVLASPYMRGGGTRNVPATRLIMSVLANRLLSFTCGGRINTFTGMVRAYDRAFFSGLTWPQVGNINVALLLHAQRTGATISEIPAELAWPPDRGAARLSFQRVAHEVVAVVRHSIDFARTRTSR